jgi:hypothetical protein
MQQLVQSGVPPEQAQQIIQAAMQMAQQQPMQQEQQMMPQQGMANGGMMQQQSGAATKIAEALQQGAQPQEVLQQLVDNGMPQEQAMAMVQAVMGQLKNQMQQQQPQQQMMAPQQPMMAASGGMVEYGGGGINHFWNMLTDSNYRNSYDDYMAASGFPSNRYNRKRARSYRDFVNKNEAFKDAGNATTKMVNQGNTNVKLAGNNENEMFPESWQTTAAGLAQAVPGIAGAAFAFSKLKDRKLTPSLTPGVTVDYTPERIALQEEGRRGIGMALDTMRRNAPTSGSYMGNARETVLRGNKVLGAQISKSWQDQKNEQAKYDFEAGKINADTKNKINEMNEGMYQNAIEQGFRSSQDAVNKVANYYTGKETRDMQRWQAQNTNTTNSRWLTLPDGSTIEVHRNGNGEFWHNGKRIG